INLSNSSVAENNAPGATVATLTAGDPDGSSSGFAEPFTYELVSGTGDTDNDAFTIDGDKLNINAAANFEARQSYSIRIRVTDNEGLTYVTTKTISVTDVNENPTSTDDSRTISEDSPVTLSISDFGTFTDVDAGNVLTKVMITSLPTAGILEYSSDGTSWSAVSTNQEISASELTANHLRFTPATNANGAPYTTIGFKVSDGTVFSDSAYTLTLNVTPGNDAPTSTDDSRTINEDSPVTLSISDFGTFTDIDAGNVLTKVMITSLPTAGILEYSSDGTSWSAVSTNQEISASELTANHLRFTPATNANGAPYTTIGFKVSDGTVFSDSAYTLTLNVTPGNDAPTVSVITSNKTENDSSYTLNLLSGASDLDPTDVLSVTDFSAAAVDGSAAVKTIPGGTLGLNGSTLTVDPTRFDFLAQGESRVITVNYNVYDGRIKTPNTATITITGVNDAPVALPATINTTENAPPISGLLTSTDPDLLGKTATYTLNAPIAGLTLNNDGHYSFDPSDPAYRYLTVGDTLDIVARYTVTDDHGATDTSTLTITITGIDTPTLRVTGVTVSESSPYAVFAVGLDKASPTDIKFTPTLISGTATVGTDTGDTLEYFNGLTWETLTGSAVINAGSASVLLRVAINNDTVYEGSESLTVATGLIDGVVSNTSGASGTIIIKDDGTSNNIFTENNTTSIPSTGSANNDRPVISVSSITVNESHSHAVFSVSLSNALTTDVIFTPSLAGDTATLTTDFGPSLEYFNGTIWASIPPGGVTIAAGSLSVQLRTPLVQDLNFSEGTERFIVNTGSVAGGVQNPAGASGIVSITDMKQLSDPVITDVTETASDPTPYDLLTADPTQVVKVTGESGSIVTLFKLNNDGTPVPVTGNIFTTTENAGIYTLDFGNHALVHGDYVVQLTKNDAASIYSNTFTIDSTPGLYDIIGRRGIVSSSTTESVTIGAVGGMDQNRLPTYWNGTDWIDSDGEVIRFSFNSLATFDQEALPSESLTVSALSSGSTLTLNTRTGSYSYNPNASADLDQFTLYASDGRNGSRLILTFDAHDTLDRDGIASSVESGLAALVNPAGGSAGDLNNDGIPDANQNAVTTLAWITEANFIAAITGTLTDTTPVIAIEVMQSTSGNTIDDTAQIYGVEVLNPASDITGGSKPSNALWDAINFHVEPLQSMGLLDADPSREGTQIRVIIDISKSKTPEGSFTGYEKFVNAEAVAAGVTDLDGHLVTTPGWYDFTQRTAHGDGARFITSGGYITAIELTITDNGLGDNDMSIDRICDPGLPVIARTAVPYYSVKVESNDRKVYASLADAEITAATHSTSPSIDFYGVTDSSRDTVVLKAWYNTITGDWFYAPEGTTPPYDCYVQQPGTLGLALATGKGAFDVHLYLNSNGITQIMGEAEANALGLTSQGYRDKGALFASAAPVVIDFTPDDGFAGAGVQDNIVLTFSDAILPGTGTIAIRNGSASGSVVESFNAATDTTHLLFSGNKLSIDPSGNLTAGTHYFVTLENGSVVDLAGNRYPGSSEYDFWTESIHNAEMAITAGSIDSGNSNGLIVGGAGALGLLAWLVF
ncbi:MAG: hypothetical protein HGB00_08675, partial [Chlorobiaceae bacterium]|nr:hypothetical protein [Chlorobiaceae bacterium]